MAPEHTGERDAEGASPPHTNDERKKCRRTKAAYTATPGNAQGRDDGDIKLRSQSTCRNKQSKKILLAHNYGHEQINTHGIQGGGYDEIHHTGMYTNVAYGAGVVHADELDIAAGSPPP
jgi:hypothetical protein